MRTVLIFQNEKKFKDFIDGVWSARAGVETGAKVKDEAVSGVAGSDNLPGDKRNNFV